MAGRRQVTTKINEKLSCHKDAARWSGVVDNFAVTQVTQCNSILHLRTVPEYISIPL